MNATKISLRHPLERSERTLVRTQFARGRATGIAGIMLAALLGVGCASNPTPSNITIGEALAVPDDSKVVVTGQVVQQIDSDHWLLRDNTGSITAQIDESLLGKVKIAPDARLRIGGTVDQDHKPPLLEAKTVQLVQ